MTRLTIIAVGLFLLCCADPAPVNYTRLGESAYYIDLPSTFNLSESRGKEGQLGYNILPTDTASTMFGFIEIAHGNPIGGPVLPEGHLKETIKSNLLDHQVYWNIYNTETGYFEGSTGEKGELNASISSKFRPEIDSLIAIISTLHKKSN